MNEMMIRQMYAVRDLLSNVLKRDEGQGMVEYALILAFVAILVIGALKLLTPQINSTLNQVTNNL